MNNLIDYTKAKLMREKKAEKEADEEIDEFMDNYLNIIDVYRQASGLPPLERDGK